MNMLSNKYVVYSVLVISIVTILGYLANRDFESLTLFLAVYLLSCYFSKKTTIRLLSALSVTILLGNTTKRHWPWREREGFKKKKSKKREGLADNAKVAEQMQKLQEALGNQEGLEKLEGLQQINPKDLEKHMKNMEPLVKSAQKLLETFEKSGVMNMLDKLTPLLGRALPKQN